MTIINPKSIAGVTSITTPSGSDNLFTVHTNNTTERVRINNDGDVIVGSGITVSPDGDIFTTGVTTSTTFVGALTGNVTGNATGLSGTPNISVGTIAGSTGTFTGDVDIADKIIHTGDTNTAIRFPAADTVSIETAGSERLRIDSSGSLLIGTTSTSGISGSADDLIIGSTNDSSTRGLTLASTTNANIRFSDDGDNATGMIEYNHSSNFMRIYVEGGEAMRIDSSRRLLLGTTTEGNSSADNLTVADSGESGITVRSGTSNGGHIYFSDATSGSAEYQGAISYQHNSDFMKFNTSGTERMRLSSAGCLSIGTDNNSVAVNNTTGISLDGANGYLAVSRVNETFGFNRDGNGNVGRFFRSGTEVGAIHVTASATSFVTSSDYRLKENVVAISDGITRLKTLKPSRFNFIADSETIVDGFLAHEVTAVPESITGTKDEVDSDNKPVYQGIDQSKLVPLLTAALQEAVTKIEVLETRLNNAGIAT